MANLDGRDAAEMVAAGYQLCTVGWVKTNKCGTEDCEGTRWNTDKSGFCRQCKVKKGMAVAPLKKYTPREERTGIAPMPREVEVKLPDNLIDGMFTKMCNMDQPAVIAGLQNAWAKLDYKAKMSIITDILAVEADCAVDAASEIGGHLKFNQSKERFLNQPVDAIYAHMHADERRED